MCSVLKTIIPFPTWAPCTTKSGNSALVPGVAVMLELDIFEVPASDKDELKEISRVTLALSCNEYTHLECLTN